MCTSKVDSHIQTTRPSVQERAAAAASVVAAQVVYIYIYTYTYLCICMNASGNRG